MTDTERETTLLSTREAKRIIWLKRRAREHRDFVLACKAMNRLLVEREGWSFASRTPAASAPVH